MQLYSTFSNYLIAYLVIGTIIAIIADVFIATTKSSERFTFKEIWICVLLWPFVVLKAAQQFFNNQY